MLVKAPLRVLYDKIQHEGWGRVANTARGEVLYLPRDPTPNAVFYRTARVYGAFTDLLVLRGRIIGVIQCYSL